MIANRALRTGHRHPMGAGLPNSECTPTAPLWLPNGQEVWTADGCLPVEHLAPGDRIIARQNGYVTLIEARPAVGALDMVRIAARALGPQQPDRDVNLPVNQPVHVRGAIAERLSGCAAHLLPALDLVAEGLARTQRAQTRRFVALTLSQSDVFYVNGLEIQAPPALT